MLRVAIFVTLAVLAQLLAAPNASAEVTCGPGKTWNGKTCVITVQTPGDEGGGGNGGGGKRKCTNKGRTIPCRTSKGIWDSARHCYVQVTRDPEMLALFKDKEGGAVYVCDPFMYAFWSPTGPSAPDPADLAQRAVTSMNLRPIRIGVVPEARQGRVGLIGLPVWLWVDEPSGQTWGPMSRTASAAGYSVTATARVNRIRWEMGDGRVVSCANRGTPYASKYGTRPSPTCGYSGYTRDGTYTVRATSFWVVTWSGMGESGTISLSLVHSAQITVGELQVVNR